MDTDTELTVADLEGLWLPRRRFAVTRRVFRGWGLFRHGRVVGQFAEIVFLSNHQSFYAADRV